MPVIPLSSADVNELDLFFMRLCINPHSLEETKTLDREIEGHTVGAIVSYLGLQNVAITQREFDLSYAADPKGVPTIYRNQTRIRDAYIAGLLLVTTLRLAHYKRKTASMGEARRLLSSSIRAGKGPKSDKALKAVWGENKTISHLTGAVWFCAKEMVPLARIIDRARLASKPEPVTWKLKKPEKREFAKGVLAEFDPLLERYKQMRLRYFAFAEELRKLGQSFFPPTRDVHRLPLLVESDMWTVPESFRLPKVRLKFAPITPRESGILFKSK